MNIKDIDIEKADFRSHNISVQLHNEIERISRIEKKIINRITKTGRDIERELSYNNSLETRRLIKKLNYYCEKQKDISEEKTKLMHGLINRLGAENKSKCAEEKLPDTVTSPNIYRRKKSNPVHYKMCLKNFYTSRIKK